MINNTSNILKRDSSSLLLSILENSSGIDIAANQSISSQILSLNNMLSNMLASFDSNLDNLKVDGSTNNSSNSGASTYSSSSDNHTIDYGLQGNSYAKNSQYSDLNTNPPSQVNTTILNSLNQQMQSMSDILSSISAKVNSTVSNGIINDCLDLNDLRGLLNKLTLNGVLKEEQLANIQDIIDMATPMDRLLKSLFDPSENEQYNVFDENSKNTEENLSKLSGAIAASVELGEQVGQSVRKLKKASEDISDIGGPGAYKINGWYMVTFVNAAAIMQQNVASFVTIKNNQINTMLNLQKLTQSYISYLNDFFSALNKVFTSITSISAFLGVPIKTLDFSLSDAQLTNFKNTAAVEFLNQEVFNTKTGDQDVHTAANKNIIKVGDHTKVLDPKYTPDQLMYANSPSVVTQKNEYKDATATNWSIAGLALPYVYAILSNEYATFDFGKDSDYGQSSIGSIFDALGLTSLSINSFDNSKLYNNTAVLKNFNVAKTESSELDPGANIAFITTFSQGLTVNDKKTIYMDPSLLKFVSDKYKLDPSSSAISSQLAGGTVVNKSITNTYTIDTEDLDDQYPTAYLSINAMKDMATSIFDIVGMYFNVSGDDQIIKSLGSITDVNNQLNTINNFTQAFNDQIQNQASLVQTNLQQLSQFMQNVLQLINSAFSGA